MKLSDVNKGIHKNRKRLRVGRGPGSGRGKTAGRGHKGQGQLAGWSSPAIFEGGRMPIIRQIPKRGFHNQFARTIIGVNVSAIDAAFAAGEAVTPESLKAKGLAKGVYDEVKILGNGAIGKALTVSAHRFSEQAKRKIIEAGGSIVELPGPAAVVKNQKKKASRKKPAGG